VSAAWNPSRWSNAPRGSFKPAPGVVVAPHLQLVRPVTGALELDVWVADQLTLQIEVAVKFAPEEGDGAALAAPGAHRAGATPGEVNRFLRQARGAARLGDPHLVQIFEQGKVKGGIPFIVMELLEGMSLSQRLLSGPLSLAEARAVLEQVAGVLAKAHPLGLWHGSLCPEHLFSSEAAGKLFVKIANFGDVSSETWANDPASKLAPDAPSRKQAYLSPEQLRQGAGSSAAADLWALGVTLYELLTTTLPFEAATSAAVSVAICNAQFSPPSHYRADLPPAVDAWFARVFAPQQSARLLDPTELAREFGRALGGNQQQPASLVAEPRSVSGPQSGDEHVAEAAGDGFEDGDERTIRWEVPSEWEPAEAHGSPPQLSRAPEAELSSARPSVGPPPLPDRPPSSRPPPYAGYAPTLAFAAPRPPSFPPVASPARGRPFSGGAIPRVSGSPISGSPANPGVAGPAIRRSATPVAVTAPSAGAGAFAGRRRFTKAQGLLAATLLGGSGALLAWGLQSRPQRSDAASEARAAARGAPLVSAEESRPRTSASSRAPASRPSERAENLVILQTDELPRAPDETADGDEGSDGAESNAAVSVRGSAGTHAAGAHGAAAAAKTVAGASGKPPAASTSRNTSTPAASTSSAKADPRPSSGRSARLDPGSAAAHPATKPSAPAAAPATPPRATGQRSPKHASADCNPPYFFDNNNIRRLKLECL